MDALILASQSKIRAQMLRQAGLVIEVAPAHVDERALEQGWLTPGKIAESLAREKARGVSKAHPNRLVLGADQTMALADQRFTKPSDRAGAKQQLQALQGQTHRLYSGFALAENGHILHSDVSTASLTMRTLSDQALEHYLNQAGNDVLASVGCYQLEGIGVTLFSKIEGDYFTILGLPLLQVLAALRDLGRLGDDR